MNKKKRALEGAGSIFSFTFKNQANGKGFVFATFVFPVILFLIFAGINIGVAYFNKEEEKDPVNLDTLLIVDETEYGTFGDLFAFAVEDDSLKGVKLIVKNNTTVKDTLKKIKEDEKYKDINWGIISLKLQKGMLSEREDGTTYYDENKKSFVVSITLPEDSSVNDDTIELLKMVGTTCASMVSITAAEVTTEQYTFLNSGYIYQVIDAGEQEDNLMVEMMKTLFPMLFVIIMYLMIILYCQSMGKVVISEKSSKLMEMMLTSVQPMAIIAGKVFALIAIALMQFGLWIISGVAGFVVGDVIAKVINPEYSNIIMVIIGLVREYGMDAFSVPGVIFALLALIFGFSQYCMISAMVASTCSKAEEVAERQGVYMLLIVAGYLFSLFCSMDDKLILVCDLIPFSAAFRLPCDALLGTIPMWAVIVSTLITIISTFLFAFLAGKVYHAQVFLRGKTMSQFMKKLIGFISKDRSKKI